MCFNETSLFLIVLGSRRQNTIKLMVVNTKAPVTVAATTITANFIVCFELSNLRASVSVVFEMLVVFFELKAETIF